MVDKELIKNRFSKSLETYEQNAVVQSQTANLLLAKLIESQGKNFDKIFEIGCGKGLLTKKIQKELIYKELFLNDMVKGFSDSNFLLGDCEKIEFPKNSDLVISNAVFQWIEDIPELLNKINSALNPDGVLAFTTFGEQNFHQIKKITNNSLNYFNQETVEKMLSQNFEIIYSASEVINLDFENAYEILNHLKLCGTNALEKTRWTKKELINFIKKYDEFITDECKSVLTYHPMYFIATKK